MKFIKLIQIMAVLTIYCIGMAGSTVTNVNQHVGPYNISFSVPGERNFNYEIDGPDPGATRGELAGMTCTNYGLHVTDKNTEETIWIAIIKYDGVFAQKAYENGDNSFDWIAFNPQFGDIYFSYLSLLGQHTADVVLDERTLVHLYYTMPKLTVLEIAESLRIESEK